MRLVITCFNLGLGVCAMLSSTFWVICSSLLLLMVYPFLTLPFLLFCYHGVRQFAQMLYFNRNCISWLHKHLWCPGVADACWRPGQNNIPRFERDDLRDVADD